MRPTNAKRFSIPAADGGTIHAGEARSWGEYVTGLHKAGISLAGADLRGAQLKHLPLDGLDLRGAILDGADLTGSSLCSARLDGASMRGVSADGLRARNASLAMADLSPLAGADGVRRPSSLLGADLTAANLRRAILDDADLCNLKARAAKFLGTRVERANLTGADLSSADLSMSRFVGCDLTDTDLSSRSGAPIHSVPNRTEGAVVMANTYLRTAIDVGSKAFRRDRLAGLVMRRASFGVSALAVAAMASLVPEEVVQHVVGQAVAHVPVGPVGHLVGGGLVLVATVKLAAFAREKVEELAGEYLGKHVMRGLRAAKSYASEVSRRGGDAATLVAALAVGPGSAVVSRALADSSGDDRDAGGLGMFREVMAGRVRVLLCDRRHLALALARLHADQVRGAHLGRDLVLVRPPSQTASSDAPLAFRMAVDGSASAVWGPASRPRSAAWDSAGRLASTAGFPGGAPSMAAAKAAFEAELWKDHDLRRPYLTGSHQIHAGRDGSIQIVHEKTGLLNNPRGAAFVGLDGDEFHYRQGEPVPAPAPAF